IPILTSTVLPTTTTTTTTSVFAARPAADTAPGQPRHELLGGFARDVVPLAQPVSRGDLGHTDHAHAQQVRLVVGEPGVLPDRLADDRGALPLGAVEPVADGGL